MTNDNQPPSDYRLWRHLLVPPRWQKVVNDIRYAKTRIMLAVVSIAVGVFAIGTVAGAILILNANTNAQYGAARPASAEIYLPGFDDGLVAYARKLPQVGEADAYRAFNIRLQTAGESGSDEWRTVSVFAIEDFGDIRLGKMWPEQGAWPPPKNTLVIERSGLSFVDAAAGDIVRIETPSGVQRDIPIGGVVFAPTAFPASISGQVVAFVSYDTLAWLEQPRLNNTLAIEVRGDNLNRGYVDVQMQAINEEIAQAGWPNGSVNVPQYPGRPPLEGTIQSVTLLLNVIGVMLTGISGLLVTNTMEALLTQQIKQIGIMRTVGGQVHQVMALYFGFVLVLAVLALLAGVLPSVIGAHQLALFAGQLLNVDIVDFSIPWYVFGAQVALAFVVAFAAALKPILTNTLQTTVRQAIQPFGTAGARQGLIEAALGRLRGLSRPVALSLRNMFRQKLRLALTLITMVLAGGVFIAVFSVQASLQNNIRAATDAFLRYDIQLRFAQPYRIEALAPLVAQVPGVARVEGWTQATATRLQSDGSDGDPMTIVAAPAGTDLLNPEILAGRWLRPGDEQAVVVNRYVLTQENVGVGSELVLTVDGRDTVWQVVGVFRDTSYGAYPGVMYANQDYFARATGKVGEVSSLQVVTDAHDKPGQATVLAAIEDSLDARNIKIRNATSSTEDVERNAELLNILVYVLLIMAMLLAVVGGISLTGTMGINVIERTREIGVMRAVGASNGDLVNITLIEGLLIGFLSWTIGAVLGWPIGVALSNALGQAMFRQDLVFLYSFGGMAGWLVLSLVISAFASIMPARSAMRITVRDAISYE